MNPEALRLLDEMDSAASWSDQQRFYEAASAKLRALLSAKEGEPSAENWKDAMRQCVGTGELTIGYIERRAIALRDAEKEKGNG